MKSRRAFFVLGLVLRLVCGFVQAQESAKNVHFMPVDHRLGDVHPFFHEGECFLYYLKPGKYESTLVRSKDWLHWTSAELVHEPAKPDEWTSPYYVLGVFRDPVSKVFRSFYGHAEGRMASSVSYDLTHWACAPKEYHVPVADYYKRRRDPFVFWIPESKQYGCVMTAWMKDRPKEKAGAVSLATSADLKQWTDHGPISDPGNIGEPECPQMFHLGEQWYLLASIYDHAVGQPVYWMSKSPLGPWEKQPSGKLDGKDLCAAQVAFDGDAPIMFGWIPLTPAKSDKQTWGGHLALPREVYALPDGKLCTRLAAKMAKSFDQLSWQSIADFMAGTESHTIKGSWNRVAAQFTLMIREGVKEVRIGFERGVIALGSSSLRVLDRQGECWSELPVQLPVNQAMQVRVFIEDDIVEVFVDERYSLAARLPKVDARLRLSFTASAPEARVSNLRVCEWALPK